MNNIQNEFGKRGIAFYLNNKFIVSQDAEKENGTILFECDIDSCFNNAKKVVYSFDYKESIIRVFGDSLIFISDKKYEKDGWEKSINRLIKLANIVISILCWTSSQYLNIKKGKTLLFVHPKEIHTSNIFHCIANEQYDSVEIKSCDGSVNHNDLLQRDKKKIFAKNNQTNLVFGYKTINEFFGIFEDNFKKVVDLEIEDIIFMLYRSILETQKTNFDISILLSFFVTEKIINLMWDKALKDKELYKKLKDDRDYTVAIKSNMLYMNGSISKEELDKIDYSRKKRNKIAHGNLDFRDNISFLEINDIYICAQELFSRYYEIDFKLQFGFSY